MERFDSTLANELRIQNMQFNVINHQPSSTEKERKEEKIELEKQLYQVLKKYD